MVQWLFLFFHKRCKKLSVDFTCRNFNVRIIILIAMCFRVYSLSLPQRVSGCLSSLFWRCGFESNFWEKELQSGQSLSDENL